MSGEKGCRRHDGWAAAFRKARLGGIERRGQVSRGELVVFSARYPYKCL
ncbi:hypothetical protein B932_1307 [Gluconobacter oxydans H24]|nr:hypothetical protein B932_1307 [Gluconobacter oxydans H24]